MIFSIAAAACNEQAATSGRPAIAAHPPDTTIASPRATTEDAPAITAAAEAGAPDAAPACPATPWSSYGHDPARTSASDGCVDGPLAVTWKFTRQGPCGYKFRAGRVLEVVAEENAIFAAVDCGGSPAVMRVTPEGAPLWTFSRADFGYGTWPAIAGDSILSTDDGVYLIDRETGKWHGRELDVWGEPAVVNTSFFVDNTFQLDGSGPFVGGFDASLKWKWRASVINAGKEPKVPRTGGVAVADGVVVHAAAMGARTVPSLAAHDASTGERRWIAPGSWPESAPSIADGRVFVIERYSGEKVDRLVARALADGSIQWSTIIPWARGAAPVIAEKVVVVHGAEGVRAHDRATGGLVWSSPLPHKAAFQENATTMAVAKGSHTLVVTSGAQLVVLALDDGAEKWSGVIVTGSTPTSLGGVTVERPVIVGRTVYVTSDGTLLRLDPK